MLETINKMGPIIEPTTLFVLIMFSILIVTALCMQPKNKYKKLLARKRAGSTGGNKKNKQFFGRWTRSQKRICCRNIWKINCSTSGTVLIISNAIICSLSDPDWRLIIFQRSTVHSQDIKLLSNTEDRKKLKTATLFSRISSQLPMKNLREKK